VKAHKLWYTFGHLLRAASRPLHCSTPELSYLLEAANRVCGRGNGKPELVVIRRLSASQLPQGVVATRGASQMIENGGQGQSRTADTGIFSPDQAIL